ncbi:hypothetical protein BYT27DRAFT_7192817 [Phlegmacium glaucopus]|nr:hypothetical protein BYT27DRAFT_7192817 [Phlegmacium glaucopus]
MFNFIGYDKPGCECNDYLSQRRIVVLWPNSCVYLVRLFEPTGHPILIDWFSFCKATNCWVWYWSVIIHDFYFILFSFHIAFAIILEYSFHLWDPAPSSSIKYLISAVNVYKSSGKHVTVTAAVEKIFEEEKELLFGEVADIENSAKSTFAQKLIQIAVENGLHLK